MSNPMDEILAIPLEDALRRNAVDAAIFAPFVIARLRAEPENSQADLWVRMDNETGNEQHALHVRLHWNNRNAFSHPIAVQERVVTEWAALGVACALLPALFGMYIVSVALEGERFDYRVSDGVTEWGLEVSGTMMEDAKEARERLRLKLRQFHDNPYGIMGYVLVVAFVRQEVLVSLPDPA